MSTAQPAASAHHGLDAEGSSGRRRASHCSSSRSQSWGLYSRSPALQFCPSLSSCLQCTGILCKSIYALFSRLEHIHLLLCPFHLLVWLYFSGRQASLTFYPLHALQTNPYHSTHPTAVQLFMHAGPGPQNGLQLNARPCRCPTTCGHPAAAAWCLAASAASGSAASNRGPSRARPGCCRPWLLAPAGAAGRPAAFLSRAPHHAGPRRPGPALCALCYLSVVALPVGCSCVFVLLLLLVTQRLPCRRALLRGSGLLALGTAPAAEQGLFYARCCSTQAGAAPAQRGRPGQELHRLLLMHARAISQLPSLCHTP